MDRIDGAGHVDHMFVAEDIDTNRPPAEITAKWLNGVQEENLGVIEGSGQTPDGADNLQVFKGIKIISRRNLGAVSAAGGTADAITAVYDPPITKLTDGMTLYVRAGSVNATTTPTFTPNSGTIAAKTIVKGNGLALAAGDIAGAGHWIELQHDATLDKWVLLNPATGVNSLGFGQAWLSMTASRAMGTTYYNMTGRPILVSLAVTSTVLGASVRIHVGGIPVAFGAGSAASGQWSTALALVPPGAYYSADMTAGTPTLSAWAELR